MGRYDKLIADLKSKKIKFDKGLTSEEFDKIEKTYGICFPKSLREMYEIALPISASFYNWRDFKDTNNNTFLESILLL